MKTKAVLILVLVEDGLGGQGVHPIILTYAVEVLILVLVEDGLGVIINGYYADLSGS